MKPFLIAADVNGQSSYSIPFSDYVNVQALAAGVAETVNLPSNAKFIIFSSTGDFYARINGTAVIPAGDITDGTGSEINPIIRSLVGVTSLSIIAPSGCQVTMAFYS